MEPVKNTVGTSFCSEIRASGNLELGQLQRRDGIFGAVVTFRGSLNRSLQVPDKQKMSATETALYSKGLGVFIQYDVVYLKLLPLPSSRHGMPLRQLHTGRK